jgi:hypothetical protein
MNQLTQAVYAWPESNQLLTISRTDRKKSVFPQKKWAAQLKINIPKVELFHTAMIESNLRFELQAMIKPWLEMMTSLPWFEAGQKPGNLIKAQASLIKLVSLVTGVTFKKAQFLAEKDLDFDCRTRYLIKLLQIPDKTPFWYISEINGEDTVVTVLEFNQKPEDIFLPPVSNLVSKVRQAYRQSITDNKLIKE